METMKLMFICVVFIQKRTTQGVTTAWWLSDTLTMKLISLQMILGTTYPHTVSIYKCLQRLTKLKMCSRLDPECAANEKDTHNPQAPRSRWWRPCLFIFVKSTAVLFTTHTQLNV